MCLRLKAGQAVTAFFLLCSISGAVGKCSNLLPVPVDETWFFKVSESGLRPVKSGGLNPKGTGTGERKHSTAKNGSATKKSCWEIWPIIQGAKSPTGVPFTCTYDNVNEHDCAMDDKLGMAHVVARQTKMSEKFKFTIVLTDNSTFVAVDICEGGSARSWAVMGINKNLKLDDNAINTALDITEKVVEADKKNPVHPNLLVVTKGECPAGKIITNLLNPLSTGLPFGLPE